MFKCYQCGKEIKISSVCGYLTCTNCLNKKCPECHKIKVYSLKKEKLEPDGKLKDYCYCDFGDGEKKCAICQSSWKGPKVYCYGCSERVDELRRKSYRDIVQKSMKVNQDILVGSLVVISVFVLFLFLIILQKKKKN